MIIVNDPEPPSDDDPEAYEQWRMEMEDNHQLHQQLAEDAARRAFERQQKSDEKMTDYDEKNRKTFTKEQKKKIKKKLSVLCKNAQRYSNGKLWVHAASFPITLKSELNEDEVVELMYEWKNNNIISWGGNLETSTQVFIDRSDLLIEDINSR